MAKIRLTVTESSCRGGYHKKGDVFLAEDLCPPLCHELWHVLYPYLFALRSGAALDRGEARAREFDACCPDGGRVRIHGELVDEGAGSE